MPKKLFIVAIMATLVFAFFLNGGQEYLNFENLKQHKATLLAYTEAHYWRAFFITGGIYILATILNLPVAIIMSLIIGFLFGLWHGVLLATFASTIGAVLVFWLARYLIADWARARLAKSDATQKIMAKLDNDALGYLLFMRAVPLFPFWLVNMTFAFSPINSKQYTVGTYVGMFPVSFVLVNLGQSLANVNSLAELFTAKVIFAFILIGLLALSTSLLMRYRSRCGEVRL